jgi:hypothetical protein
MIGYQDQPNHERWYVADLPGHNGDKPIKSGNGKRSDWGWTTDRKQALSLSPYWQRRFMAFVKRDHNRTGGLQND